MEENDVPDPVQAPGHEIAVVGELLGNEGDEVVNQGEDEIVDSDYEQEVNNIAKETCVDQRSNWDGFQVSYIHVGEEKMSQMLMRMITWKAQMEQMKMKMVLIRGLGSSSRRNTLRLV